MFFLCFSWFFIFICFLAFSKHVFVFCWFWVPRPPLRNCLENPLSNAPEPKVEEKSAGPPRGTPHRALCRFDGDGHLLEFAPTPSSIARSQGHIAGASELETITWSDSDQHTRSLGNPSAPSGAVSQLRQHPGPPTPTNKLGNGSYRSLLPWLCHHKLRRSSAN